MLLTKEQCEAVAEVYNKYYSKTMQYTEVGLNRVICMMTERQQKIIELRIINGMTYEQIGNILGVSKETVRIEFHKIARFCNKPGISRLLLELNPNPITLQSNINELNLSTRAYTALARKNIKTVGELSKYTYDDLRKIRNLGENSILEIKEVLKDIGINLVIPGDAKPDIIDDNTDIGLIGLSTRTYNALRNGGIHTLGELKKSSDEDLLRIRFISGYNLSKIKETLSNL